MVDASTGGFTQASTRPVLRDACAVAGLPAAGATLLRLGENAIYRLEAAPVVVRIARSLDMLDDVRKEVRVARWLAEEDFPAVRLTDHAGAEPLIVRNRYPVTFWRSITTTAPDPDETDLGRLLRHLHGLVLPAWVRLPEFNPFVRVAERLEAAPPAADPDDIAFLRRLLADLRDRYADLEFVFPPSAVHGDAHLSNLLRDSSGAVIMLDLETFAHGHREWDLTVTGMRRDGFDWLTAEQYRAFSEAYGYDIHGWPGFPFLRAVRELTMTTWLMQLVDDPTAAREFHRRVDDIRSGRYPRRWKPF